MVRQGHRYNGHRLVPSGFEPQTISYITKYFLFYIAHSVRLHFPTTLEHRLVAYYKYICLLNDPKLHDYVAASGRQQNMKTT